MAEGHRAGASGPIREPAAAKLNLFLRVVGRREDGYHEVETFIQPVTLADGVEVGLSPSLSLTVVGPGADSIPRGDDNLMIRAARALAEEAGIEPRARLLLAKNVPTAGGLGGGSADAAATLRALNDLWALGLPRERLLEIAAGLGMDVPALVYDGPVMARGRGDVVEAIDIPQTWWVLVPLDLHVATADAYAWWDEDGGTSGPDHAPIQEALAKGDLRTAGPLLYNDLEPHVVRRNPQVGRAKQRLLAFGALGAVMSGSGPTVAALCSGPRQAEDLAVETGGLVAASIHGA